MISRRQLAIVIGAGVFALTLVFLLRPGGGSSLERWKRAQRAQGEKLTLAELAPDFAPVTNQNFQRFIAAAERLHDVYFDPSQLNHLIFLAPGEARPVWSEPEVRRRTL